MKKNRFTEAQIFAVLRQAEGGGSDPRSLPGARDEHRYVLRLALEFGGMEVSMVTDMNLTQDEKMRVNFIHFYRKPFIIMI